MPATIGLKLRIAIVDDYEPVRKTVAIYLRHCGHDIRMYPDGPSFLSSLQSFPADILITDFRMPGMDGIVLLKEVKKCRPETDVIILTAHADKNMAIRALKLGAFDLFEKPVSRPELIAAVERTARFRAVIQERDRLAGQVAAFSESECRQWGLEGFVGQTKPWKEAVRQIKLLQKAPNIPVLIIGESGTGKEIVSRAIHCGGERATKQFIPVNCASIPHDLAESTLFGHKKGSFTGAVSEHKGCFDLADGGTLFLDEIGDMPTIMQAKLLRVLEDGIIVPVGAGEGHKVDARIIAATNVKIDDKIADKSFRSDLFFRLSAYTITLAPLRERKDDIPLLAGHFIRKLSAEMGIPSRDLNPDVLAVLKEHDYPGNIRELKNIIERALIESGGNTLKPEHIHFAHMVRTGDVPRKKESTLHDAPSQGARLDLKGAEEEAIRKAMRTANGNISSAARLLGIGRAKLYRKLAGMHDKNP